MGSYPYVEQEVYIRALGKEVPKVSISAVICWHAQLATASTPPLLTLRFKQRHWAELHERAPSIRMAEVDKPVLGVRENRLEGWEVQGE